MYESEARWREVDDYFVDTLVPEDDALEAARRSGHLTTMPSAEVAPNQGRLLALLAQMSGARRADERVRGVRRVLEDIAKDPRLEATALQTVGSKGWDGLTIIRRTS
ncbi:O-methyltransferase [Actinoplanes sp. N902-109]|uniref:O-methyltransferase n=1 Tax=Actinoplanes sp. (strain N902-109) TaxID=649831 RepID=UPI0003293580|nr:O-methyltransferase [Actinoplanes sp. N902-109]AGL16210.1 O-methyltransferase [Actinoplanes sp. N902-109]